VAQTNVALPAQPPQGKSLPIMGGLYSLQNRRPNYDRAAECQK
jgi:hypothetical protein